MAEKLFKALAKKMGKDKSMSILQKMANGGMPKDVTQLMQARMGTGSMINPELSMADGRWAKGKIWMRCMVTEEWLK